MLNILCTYHFAKMIPYLAYKIFYTVFNSYKVIAFFIGKNYIFG